MGKIYSVVNGPAPGAAATPKVTTGTVVKTLIQMSAGSTGEFRVVQHWIEFDGSAAATPIQYELLKLAATTPATVTAYVAADIAKVNDPNARASNIALGATASGYSASAEGTLVTPVTVEQHLVPPTSGVYIQFPLGREPEVGATGANSFLRSRVTAGAAVNAIAGIMWEE
jgi:hypothetical protein